MRTADFDFELPPNLIAQVPAPERDQSRLLILRRDSGRIEHRSFRDLPGLLCPGDVLVLNDSRVIPARLRGTNARTGGQFEVLLLEQNATNDWWAMLRPGKRARPGTRILLLDPAGQPAPVHAVVLEKNDEGHRRLQFLGTPDIAAQLDSLGEVPLPPYIDRPDASQRGQDRARYQTVFARADGSVAAPTAGLHFTKALLDEIRARGVQILFVTLHVGLGTFAPVKTEIVAGHIMHEERYELSEETARGINAAKREGRRVLAVGTTTLRVLEDTAAPRHASPGRQESTDGPGSMISSGSIVPTTLGKTRLFIYPPYQFQTVDILLTNFHLPRSTLLMLASAFAAPGKTRGRALLLAAYGEAVRERYRFFSYGDAMLIL